MKKPLYVTLLFSGALLCNGCWVTKQQGLKIEADINNLGLQNQQLKRSQEEFVARTAQRLNELVEQTTAISKKLDYLDQSAHRGTADVGMEVSALKQELAALRGEIEVTTNNLQQMGQRVDKVEQDVQTPPVQVAPPPPIFTTESGNTKQVATTETPKAAEKNVTKEEKKETAKKEETPKADPKKNNTAADILAEAEQLLKNKKPEEAARKYNEILANRNGKYKKGLGVTDVAIYGIGRSWDSMGKYKQSIEQYFKLFNDYPNSEYADNAVFLMAAAYSKEGDNASAEAYYNFLLQNYPKSELVSDTKKAIDKLHSKSKKGKK